MNSSHVNQQHSHECHESAATQYRCCDCDREFKSEHGLKRHLRHVKVHRPKKTKTKAEEGTPAKPMCQLCNREFKTIDRLKQHLNSLRHNPLSDIQCLASSECKRRFISPSGQLAHLESGRCVSSLSKIELNGAIASRDTGGIITSGGVTGQWVLDDASSTSSISQSGSPILTPTTAEFDCSYPPSGSRTPTEMIPSFGDLPAMVAVQIRKEAPKQQCPLCPSSNPRKFLAHALRDHLLSSVHAKTHQPACFPEIVPAITFHCPRGLMGEGSKKVVKQFSTVSGLAQHLESGVCAGGKGTLKYVVDFVQEELKNMGFGERKLLL